MITKSTGYLFELRDTGLALFDENGTLLFSNNIFRRYCRQPSSLLNECFPETVGLEEIIRKIARGHQKTFYIENINRPGKKKDAVYLNLSLHHFASSAAQVVCFVWEVTSEAILKQRFVQKENEISLLKTRLAAKSSEGSALIGHSKKVETLRTTVVQIAQIPNINILLRGESGTGKNLIAREIHTLSSNARKPFIEINCAAIPEHLLESELFGYEKGAFTNAAASKKGLLEEAHEGTLFLDEIAELPLALQAKLLHIIESRRFRRLGSNREQQVEFRLITASNKNLQQLVSEKKFREDLLFRLNVVQIELPPLRSLEEDILLLAEHFMHLFNLRFNKKAEGFTKDARQALLEYSWPGNVRELSNLIERAMIFNNAKYIKKDDLVFQSGTTSDAKTWSVPDGGIKLEEVEQKLLLSALSKTNGNKARAAQLLGLTRDTLRYRLEKYKL